MTEAQIRVFGPRHQIPVPMAWGMAMNPLYQSPTLNDPVAGPDRWLLPFDRQVLLSSRSDPGPEKLAPEKGSKIPAHQPQVHPHAPHSALVVPPLSETRLAQLEQHPMMGPLVRLAMIPRSPPMA